MQNVAIMGLFGCLNYGNSLQSAALYRVIRDAGYQPETIAYRGTSIVPPFTPTSLKKLFTSSLRLLPKVLISKKKVLFRSEEKIAHFHSFQARHETMTGKIQTASELYTLNDQFDAFVCGSDQIWSSAWYTRHFFLDFVENDAKKVAYAPSFGQAKIPHKAFAEDMKVYLRKIRHLSVREMSGQDILRSLIGSDVNRVLDPALLLTPEQWSEYENPEVLPDKPYILCYFLGKSERPWKHTRKIAKKLGLELCIIPVYVDDLNREGIIVKDAGPAEFLSLIRNASYVCADSFHATAFSILYHRPFTVFDIHKLGNPYSTNTRMHSLLRTFMLMGRLVRSNARSFPKFAESIDYDHVEATLKKERKESKYYLQNALCKACASPKSERIKITNTCSGCGACAFVCPTGAIRIDPDELGFRTAVVNYEVCNRCNQCREVCPFNGKRPAPIADGLAMYAFKAGADALRISSSGGFSWALGEHMAKAGYSMAGCVSETEHRRVSHRIATPSDAALRQYFRGSKYVQSDISDVLAAATTGANKMLFIGTPCQVAGVAKLLGDDRHGGCPELRRI